MKLRASSLSLAFLVAAGPACAQTSVQKKLDACIRSTQEEDSAAGGVLGFLSHFSFSRTTSSGTGPPPTPQQQQQQQQHAGGAGLGAVTAGGSALGLAAAYFNAMHECLDEHPDWLPASQLSTAADYKAAVAQVGYDSATGPMIQPESITMPTEARPDTHFQVRSRFLVLTPDGSEVKVEIGRRLFAVSEGGEQELTIPAPAQERRTLPAGEHEDVVNLLIPKNAPLGVSYRVEFSVGAARGKPAATMVSATVKVL
jgi:hypothetical protein